MKPSPQCYLLAYTAEASVAIGVFGALGIMVSVLHSEGILSLRADALLWVVIAAIPVAAIGGILGLFVLWGIVFGRLAAWLQGWPFVVEERVWILRGKFKNKVATVYEVWPSRGQVRVDLGPDAQARVEDVFCAVAVCRANASR